MVTYKNHECAAILIEQDFSNKFPTEEYAYMRIEYNLVMAIKSLVKPHKSDVAFIDGHGELNMYNTAWFGSQLGATMKYFYNVTRDSINGKINCLRKISIADSTEQTVKDNGNKYDLLVIAQPTQPFSDKDKYAIDQHLMRGGRILWLIDGTDAALDSLQERPEECTLSISSNYFMEIAKLRAFRMLWATMLEQYKPQCDCAYKIRINSVASTWNKTIYDPYVNMLRTTTEGMSAALGGADSITLQPFDVTYKKDDDFSRRISRNVQIILKEESYFDKVVDPAAGSYYIENLTDSIAEYAWKLFQSVEAEGGIITMTEDGRIKAAIEESCNKRNMNIATRRYILLGTNQYPNINEQMADKVEKKVEETNPGLRRYRGAMAFEELRLETERQSAKTGRPKVFLLKIGNLAMRQARAGFVTNVVRVTAALLYKSPYVSLFAALLLGYCQWVVCPCERSVPFANLVVFMFSFVQHCVPIWTVL